MSSPMAKPARADTGRTRHETNKHNRPLTSGSPRISKKSNKRQRQEETKKLNESGSSVTSSFPPAKKSRPSNFSTASNQSATHNKTPHNVVATEPSPPENQGEARSVLTTLSAYDVTNMNIISSSQIQAKVTRILDKLSKFSFVAPMKPSIVMVRAKGPVSSKLITIIEIAKRDIAKSGGKWYQYNSLDPIMVFQENKAAAMSSTGRRHGETTDPMDLDDKEEDQVMDEDQSTFETMKTPLERAIEATPKVRAIPVLTTYLSRVRIEGLKKTYGEQTNALT